MIYEPQTRIYLLRDVNLFDYSNQMDFVDLNAQKQFFRSKIWKSFTNFRFIRKNSSVRIPINYEESYPCDYVIYQNQNFNEDRWIYCFIKQKNYLNDGTTEFVLEMDLFQTYLFDFQLQKCLISRSHTEQFWNKNPIRPYYNLNPEGLEFGNEYDVYHIENPFNSTYQALLCCSVDLEKDFGSVGAPKFECSTGGIVDGLPTSLNYYFVSLETDLLYEVLEHIQHFAWIAQCIQSITVVPSEIIKGSGTSTITVYGSTLTIGKIDSGFVSSDWTSKTYTNFLQYFPTYHNSKLYSYPYSFIEMTLYNGSQFIIKPECVDSDTLELSVVTYLGSQPKIDYYVADYNFGSGCNYIEYSEHIDVAGDFLNASVSLTNMPQLPVMIDNYNLYMANNANTFAFNNALNNYNKKEAVVMSAINGGVGVIGNLLSMNPGGALQSGLSAAESAYTGVKNAEVSIRQQMAKQQDAEISPPTVAGQSGGDSLNIANGIRGVTLKWKSIKPQFATQLESYFERYGYSVNRIDYPSYVGCSSFNYIQTVGCVITGNIPSDEVEILQAAFDSGITVWHNGTPGKYSRNEWIE